MRPAAFEARRPTSGLATLLSQQCNEKSAGRLVANITFHP
jgi:hypothetical protein